MMPINPNDLIEYFQNQVCPICAVNRSLGGFTTWFRVLPASAQSLHNQGPGIKAAYERKIQDAIHAQHYQVTGCVGGKRYPLNILDPENIYDNGSEILDTCVSLFFGLSPKCTDKDVDNMAKLFLDSIKGPGGLISDDKSITHLEVIKRRLISDPASMVDNYLVGVRIAILGSATNRAIPFTWSSSVCVI